MLYSSLRLMSWLKNHEGGSSLGSALATNPIGIAWMLPKLCIADSKFVVNVLTKIFATRPDVTAGSPQTITIPLSVTQQVADILAGRHRYKTDSISVDSKINQQSQEKFEERDCEIQGSQEGIHRLSAVLL
jgi:hypothetical protein